MTTKLDYGGVGPLKKIGGLPIQSYLVLWNVKSKHHIENLGFKQLHTQDNLGNKLFKTKYICKVFSSTGSGFFSYSYSKKVYNKNHKVKEDVLQINYLLMHFVFRAVMSAGSMTMNSFSLPFQVRQAVNLAKSIS